MKDKTKFRKRLTIEEPNFVSARLPWDRKGCPYRSRSMPTNNRSSTLLFKTGFLDI